MINDLRLICFKHGIYALTVPNRSDKHFKIKGFIFSFEFLLDIISIVFIDIKNYELLRLMSGNLPAKLAAD